MATRQPVSAAWKTASLAKLEEAKKPSAIVRFLFQDILTQLVNACSVTRQVPHVL